MREEGEDLLMLKDRSKKYCSSLGFWEEAPSLFAIRYDKEGGLKYGHDRFGTLDLSLIAQASACHRNKRIFPQRSFSSTCIINECPAWNSSTLYHP